LIRQFSDPVELVVPLGSFFNSLQKKKVRYS
jgi:hypothetical protein